MAEEEIPPPYLIDEKEGQLKQGSWGQQETKEDDLGEETEGLTLVDARNVFNEISCLAMLCMVRHRWPSGVIFALN